MAAPAWCCLGPQPPWALVGGALPLRLGAGVSWCRRTENSVVARWRGTLTSSHGLRMVWGWQLGAAYLKGLCSQDWSQKRLGWSLVAVSGQACCGALGVVLVPHLLLYSLRVGGMGTPGTVLGNR